MGSLRRQADAAEDETHAGCPSCSSSRVRRFSFVEGHTLVRCTKCDLVFVSPRPTRLELTTRNTEYFSKPSSSESCMQVNRRAFFEDCLAGVQARVSSGTLLDVGAAYGDFLQMARSRGYDVFGIEVSLRPCTRMKEKNIPCYFGDLEEAPIRAGSVDIVTFWDVLEHLPNPGTTLRTARRLLRQGGLVAATVPNRRFQTALVSAEALLGRDTTRRWEIPSHLNHFSATAIREAFNNSGFGAIEIRPAFPTPLRLRYAHATKRVLYRIATAANAFTRLNIGNELLVFAVAKEDT